MNAVEREGQFFRFRFESSGKSLPVDGQPQTAPLKANLSIRELPRLDLADLDAVTEFANEAGVRTFDTRVGLIENYVVKEALLEPLEVLQRASRHIFVDRFKGGRDALLKEASVKWRMQLTHKRVSQETAAAAIVAEIWRDVDFYGLDLWEPPLVWQRAHPAEVIHLLSVLNTFLQPLQVAVRPHDFEPDPVDGLFALAHQLVGWAEAKQGIKVCRLEKCGRVFAEHDGPSASGRRRSDVMYCSQRCSKRASKLRVGAKGKTSNET